MSFASQTKKELTQIESRTCCLSAELAAMIRMNGTVADIRERPSLDISTENAAIARRIYTILRKQYDTHAEVLVRKKMRLKKNNVYVVRVPYEVSEILHDLKIVTDDLEFTPGISPDIISKACCRRSFLRGVFLAAGSVNDPESSSYHLEVASSDEHFAQALLELINEKFQLHAKLTERKKGFVIYLKEGEKIVEFLSIIGAHQALLHFEDVRVLKGMRNQVNRLVNCETANLNKTIIASVRQMENIRLIEKSVGFDQLPPKLREVAELRIRYPEINLKELGALLTGNVSKSGVNHRLRKLDEWADRIRTGGGPFA